VYATVADLRAEGVTPLQADNARLRALIDEATAFIDEVTGRFFEPRALTLRLDGRGTPSLEPPVPPIRLDRVNVDGLEVPLGSESLIFVGAPVAPGFSGARMLLRGGRVFPRGEQNVEATGLWGYTERNGLPAGRTPPAIRRAAMLLVLRWIPYMGDVDAAADARNRWRLVEERTRDQSYRLDRVAVQGHITGDPEIDAALIRYRRPPGLGAA
jgi:hypothetical protein